MRPWRLDWRRQFRGHRILPLAPQPLRLFMVVTVAGGEMGAPKR
jgi:hypothetical protein